MYVYMVDNYNLHANRLNSEMFPPAGTASSRNPHSLAQQMAEWKKSRREALLFGGGGLHSSWLTQRVHVPNNLVLGIWAIVIIVQVLGKYMIIRYLDP